MFDVQVGVGDDYRQFVVDCTIKLFGLYFCDCSFPFWVPSGPRELFTCFLFVDGFADVVSVDLDEFWVGLNKVLGPCGFA